MNPTDPLLILIVAAACMVSASIGCLIGAVIASRRLAHSYERGYRDAEDYIAAQKNQALKDALPIRPHPGEHAPPVPHGLRQHFVASQITPGK